MLKTLCYISTISSNTTMNDIEILSKIVAEKNKTKNITGIMILLNGHSFQIMEGEESIIKSTFRKIKADKRHYGVIKLIDKKTDYRMFETYESGSFVIISDYTKIKKLKIHLDWIKNADISAIDELVLLTNNFLHYNK